LSRIFNSLGWLCDDINSKEKGILCFIVGQVGIMSPVYTVFYVVMGARKTRMTKQFLSMQSWQVGRY